MTDDLPPLPEWTKCDDLGGLVPSEVRVSVRAYGDARVAAAVAQERERCAQVCDEHASIEGIAQKCAAAIRAGS